MAFYQPFYGYQQPNQQIQNGGFVSVRSQKEAWEYPIAPGNSVTFIDAVNKRCYIKTKDYSPFKEPDFEIYRLVQETPQKPENAPENGAEKKETPVSSYVDKSEFDKVSAQFSALKIDVDAAIARIEALEGKIDTPKKTTGKKDEK